MYVSYLFTVLKFKYELDLKRNLIFYFLASATHPGPGDSFVSGFGANNHFFHGDKFHPSGGERVESLLRAHPFILRTEQQRFLQVHGGHPLYSVSQRPGMKSFSSIRENKILFTNKHTIHSVLELSILNTLSVFSLYFKIHVYLIAREIILH